MRLRTFAYLLAALVCAPALATAQTPAMFSNLANPAIGMNALFSGQAAHNVDEPYGLQFDEAEISLISVVDPYWTFTSNIVSRIRGCSAVLFEAGALHSYDYQEVKCA